MFSLSDSLAHLVSFVHTQPLMNPIMKHSIVVNANVTDEEIMASSTSPVQVAVSIPDKIRL